MPQTREYRLLIHQSIQDLINTHSGEVLTDKPVLGGIAIYFSKANLTALISPDRYTRLLVGKYIPYQHKLAIKGIISHALPLTKRGQLQDTHKGKFASIAEMTEWLSKTLTRAEQTGKYIQR